MVRRAVAEVGVGGSAGTACGRGKSGIEPTEEIVDGREEAVAAMSSTESLDPCSSCGEY